MTPCEPFAELALLLAIAAAVCALAVRLRQPVLIAWIAVGIAVGPSGLELVRAHDQIDLLAQIGVAVLLFLVGLRLDLPHVRHIGAGGAGHRHRPDCVHQRDRLRAGAGAGPRLAYGALCGGGAGGCRCPRGIRWRRLEEARRTDNSLPDAQRRRLRGGGPEFDHSPAGEQAVKPLECFLAARSISGIESC
ncbi:MAG: hypothetical protein B7X91_02085 [Hydrogenophilales bacterium 17-64-11]|nr:MAG: hypothetical protein B7X91_02085 [Hydrogenophilales bacterium 17-64-11]